MKENIERSMTVAGEITIIGETGSVCSRTLTLLGQTRASGSKTVTILGETRTLQCKLIFSVTVASADASQGTASGGGEVEYGQSITIRAAAKAGYAFSHWTKNGAAVQGAGAVYTYAPKGNDAWVAYFKPAATTFDVVCSLSVSDGYWIVSVSTEPDVMASTGVHVTGAFTTSDGGGGNIDGVATADNPTIDTGIAYTEGQTVTSASGGATATEAGYVTDNITWSY